MFNHHSIIPWGSFRGRQEEKWGSFRGQFGDHFRVGDHFGVGIISGAVQIHAPPMVVKMTGGLKTSMSLSLTLTLLMEAASYDFGNVETQITARPGRSC